jgi:hypothetical protein
MIAALGGRRELAVSQLERALRADPALPPHAANEARRMLANLAAEAG